MFRVGFLGRGRLGLKVLEGLLANPEIEVPVIVSCGATPEVEDVSGRMRALAAERGIDHFHSDRINRPEFERRLAGHRLDLAVAMLWLHTIDASIIRTARLGFINCHGGHLPKYRGNACANWAILNGEPFIGTSAHLMTPGELDNGPVILADRVEIGPDTYVGELIEALEEKGGRLVLDAVEAFRTGTAAPVAQDESEASYCYPRLPRDGEIDWSRPAEAVRRLVRAAGRPYPGAYSWFEDVRAGGRVRKLVIWRARVESHPLNEFHAVPGHVLRLEGGTKWAVACGDGRLLVLEEIEIDGESVRPELFFRTVRQRLGLDHSTLAARALGLGPMGSRFAAGHGPELERLEAEVAAIVDLAAARLGERGVAAAANPLRNYSFQKRWFDWERRERWFGVQIYRSLRPTAVDGEPFAIGFWLFGNDKGEIERRLYLALKPDHAAARGGEARARFPGGGEACVTEAGDVQGLYLRVDWDAERVAEAIAGIAEALSRPA